MRLLALLPLIAAPAAAHLAMWHESMWGANGASSFPIMGGYDWPPHKDDPPREGAFLELPAGGSLPAKIACDKGVADNGGENACPHDYNSLHVEDESKVKGTALSIAYTSDENSVQPTDFAVISVDFDSPFKVDVNYQIPQNLPECPEGGCLCMWGWVHDASRGADENYLIMFRCKVTGGGSGSLPAPVAPGPGVSGLKQMHLWMWDGPKNYEGGGQPFYNDEFGFTNGAQDIGQGASSGGNTGGSSGSKTSSSAGSSSTGGGNKGSGNNGGGNSGNSGNGNPGDSNSLHTEQEGGDGGYGGSEGGNNGNDGNNDWNNGGEGEGNKGGDSSSPSNGSSDGSGKGSGGSSSGCGEGKRKKKWGNKNRSRKLRVKRRVAPARLAADH